MLIVNDKSFMVFRKIGLSYILRIILLAEDQRLQKSNIRNLIFLKVICE